MNLANIPTELSNQMLAVFHKAGAFAGSQVFDSKQAEAFNAMPASAEMKELVFNAYNSGMQNVTLWIGVFLLIGTFASAILIKNKKNTQNGN